MFFNASIYWKMVFKNVSLDLNLIYHAVVVNQYSVYKLCSIRMCNNNIFLYNLIFQINPLKHLFSREGPQP